jgi:hypothetical protein
MGKVTKMKRALKTWTTDVTEFSYVLNEQEEFHITNKGQLIQHNRDEIDNLRRWGTIDQDEKFIHSFFLPCLASYHTTDYVRWAFEELYPDKDFDLEFETDQPGVFQRILELGYGDIEDKARELKLNALTKILDELGYKLDFIEKPTKLNSPVEYIVTVEK